MSTKINSIVRSFIIVPMIASTLSMSAFTASIDSAVLTKEQTVQSQEDEQARQMERECAAKIDAYFAQYDLPLAGHGMTFATEATKNDLPCTLLAAIGMAESTGGKFSIPGTFNYFGWGSGKIKFASVDEAIAEISANLGGNDDATDHYYSNKSVEQILDIYNPPRIAPGYKAKVLGIMKHIDRMSV